MSEYPDFWNVVLEEYKLLQEIVARQTEHIMKVRNWMITVLAGLSFAALSGSTELQPWAIPVVGAFVAFLFFGIEYNSELVHNKAIGRIEELEKLLQTAYSNEKNTELSNLQKAAMVPSIAKSITKSNWFLYKLIYLGALILMGLLYLVQSGALG